MNFEEPIEIAPDTYWVGFYDQKAHLHCNPYIIIESEEAILIDPGSVPHFPIVASKIISLIDPRKIRYIIISHGDPDVAGSLSVFEELINNPQLKIITSNRATFWIDHYGVKSSYFFLEENNQQLLLKNERLFKFIYTPYLHSPSSFVTYDTKHKILFSSDLFGATSEDWDLFAKGDYPVKMKKFHLFYMPSQEILKYGIEQIEKFDIEIIAPQHGSIIKKSMIKELFECLKNLNCGAYLREFGL